MFSTFKQRLLLAIFILLILSIPTGAYLVSQNQTIKSTASEPKPKPKLASIAPRSTTSPQKALLSAAESNLPISPPSPQSSPTDSSLESSTVATSFGPTLSLKAILEGRPKDNQVTSLFVGIIEGDLTQNPKFLLNFTVDLPASGIYSNLSLAGLTVGSKYTALLKSSAQIATSSAFYMTPTVSNLNDSNGLNLLSGDLNDDNVINSADYSIVLKAFGSTATSENWNALADLNLDGLINVIDLSIISKNLGAVGASGSWTSPTPSVASSSASLNPPPSQGGNSSPALPAGRQGYWVWIPK